MYKRGISLYYILSERQLAVSGDDLDHTTIRADLSIGVTMLDQMVYLHSSSSISLGKDKLADLQLFLQKVRLEIDI